MVSKDHCHRWSEKRLDKLFTDLSHLLTEQMYTDCSIKVSNKSGSEKRHHKKPNVSTVFRTHKVILSSVSVFLRQKLTETDVIEISGDPELFRNLLGFVYGGKLVFREVDVSGLVHLSDQVLYVNFYAYCKCFVNCIMHLRLA